MADEAVPATGLKERETYTAKQVATRIGTDAKTLRKFFRSAASTVEPVGQGGRYEFDAADLPKIRAEFVKWNKGKADRAAAAAAPRSARGRVMRSIPGIEPVVEEEPELDLDDLLDDEPED